MSLRDDCNKIVEFTIINNLPQESVRNALKTKQFNTGRIILISIGKAAWTMAKTANEMLGERIDSGIVITKYDHSNGDIKNFTIYEAGHPVPDENSFNATIAAMKIVENLNPEDNVLFLVSGGGSALFELPLISATELFDITRSLLACGADIVEMNTVRKRLSSVKGGKFAELCAPAHVHTIVLSDIIGDPLDMIASGPAHPDHSTCTQAMEIVKKYDLTLSKEAYAFLNTETPKKLDNVTSTIIGSVRHLCESATKICEELGYSSQILTDCLCCEAKEAGIFLSSIAQFHANSEKSLAFIVGGETIVRLIGNGLGGRNQELALSSAVGIANLQNIAIFSLGSDGTDGPTDAAGGYVDFTTKGKLESLGINIYDVLCNNDSYHALKKIDGLIMTGPTGTNVNDVAVLLIKR